MLLSMHISSSFTRALTGEKTSNILDPHKMKRAKTKTVACGDGVRPDTASVASGQPPHRVWRDQGARGAACDE